MGELYKIQCQLYGLFAILFHSYPLVIIRGLLEHAPFRSVIFNDFPSYKAPLKLNVP